CSATRPRLRASGMDLHWPSAHLLVVIAAIVVILLLSALFSLAETALTAASRPRLHQLAREGDRKAAIVNELRAQSERLIGTLLLGNNALNILASALATGILITTFGDAGVAYATAVMTVLVLVFAEVLPKTLALNSPDRLALALGPVIRPIVLLLRPATRA